LKHDIGGGGIPLHDLSNQPVDEEEEKRLEEQEVADELRFYMNQIYRIIKPVVACIILSIFWVKVAFGGQSDYR
jgi:presenilin 1